MLLLNDANVGLLRFKVQMWTWQDAERSNQQARCRCGIRAILKAVMAVGRERITTDIPDRCMPPLSFRHPRQYFAVR